LVLKSIAYVEPDVPWNVITDCLNALPHQNWIAISSRQAEPLLDLSGVCGLVFALLQQGFQAIHLESRVLIRRLVCPLDHDKEKPHNERFAVTPFAPDLVSAAKAYLVVD
jgi:hypothetical protein